MKKIKKLGIVRNSFNDSPSGTARVFFFPGCNLRCSYCYNVSLVEETLVDGLNWDFNPSKENNIYEAINDNMKFSNQGPFLGDEWIIFSGGEPSLRYSEIKRIVDLEQEIRYQKSIFYSEGDQLKAKEIEKAWQPKFGFFSNAIDSQKIQKLLSLNIFNWASVDLKLISLSSRQWLNYLNSIQWIINQTKDLQFQTVLYRTGQINFEKILRRLSDFIEANPTANFVWNINELSNMNGEIKLLDPGFNFDLEHILPTDLDYFKNKISSLKEKNFKNLKVFLYGNQII